LKASNWRIWPLTAATIVVLFVGWDISLMSRTHTVQSRISSQVDLLDRLSDLNAGINQLGIVHRVDVNTGQRGFARELEHVRSKVASIAERHPQEPGIATLPAAMDAQLAICDSLHKEVLSFQGAYSEQRMPEAVFQMMLQRAQKQVDRANRSVHEQGLGIQTAALTAKWDEAQLILILAILFALISAMLVGMARKLLVATRERTTQLASAKSELEQTNKQGREGGDDQGDPPPREEQPADREEPDPLPAGSGDRPEDTRALQRVHHPR
jgi:hypothetical protein